MLLGPGGAALRIDTWEVGTRVPLLPWSWYLLVCTMDAVPGTVRLVQRPARRVVGQGVEVEQRNPAATDGDAGAPGARRLLERRPRRRPLQRPALEAPRLWDRALSAAEVDALFTDGLCPATRWPSGTSRATSRLAAVTDVSGNGHDGELVNMPMRAVTGRRWTRREHDWRRAPAEYGAIHFHDDDLEDAGWEPDFELDGPGRPAERRLRGPLRAGRGRGIICRSSSDRRAARPRRPIAFLAPTLSYLAYANEHYPGRPTSSLWAPGNVLERLHRRDRVPCSEHRC